MLKSFFDPNGAFARGMERVWSLIVLNVLWLVCSLPVVTMGASCAALYQVLGKLIAGEDGHVARQFFRAWGENWKKATPVWLILLAVAALCGFDLYMARLNDSFLWELLAVFALQLAAMARGASMLLGVVTNGDIAVRDGDGSTVMLTLDTCRAAIRPVWDGGTLARVDVTLKLRASIAELRVPRRITAQAYQDELNAALAALVTGWAEDVIAVSQALGADFLGVGQALAIGGGRRWAAIRDDWPAVWQAVPVRVTVSADVGRTFDLRDGIDTSGGGT